MKTKFKLWASAAAMLFCTVSFAQISPRVKHAAIFKSWQIQPKVANNYWDTLKSGNPQILVDEDFTDGAFDDLGSGDPQNPNWSFYGGETGWRVPMSRPGVPMAAARRPANGGAAWEGVIWHIPNKYWYLDKYDDVHVVEFAGYSDLARRPETYGVEVAMLEGRSQFCGHPHYCHDLSWETLLAFTNDRSQQSMQLETNVENTNNRSPLGVRQAHYTGNNGYADDNYLGGTWKSKVVWRNDLVRHKVNVEQWGAANYADYWLDTFMTSMLEPQNKFALFDEIQVALFRAGVQTGSPLYVRTGVPQDSAQVGITWCKVGMTKKSDFNLDYVINQADADILVGSWGRTDTTTILQGDATNDNRIEINDANSLVAFWSQPVIDSVTAMATYDPATGEIMLSGKNISYIKLSSPSGQFTGTAPNWSTMAPLASTDSDSAIGAFTSLPATFNNLSLGNVAATGLNPANLFVTFNYLGSGVSDGFTIPMNTASVISTDIEDLIISNRNYFIGQNRFSLQAEGSVNFKAFSVEGKLLEQGIINPDSPTDISLGKGYRIIHFTDNKGRQLGTHRLVIN